MRLRDGTRINRRRMLGKSAVGGSRLLVLAAMALMAGMTPVTFAPLVGVALVLFVAGFALIFLVPLGLFLW